MNTWREIENHEKHLNKMEWLRIEHEAFLKCIGALSWNAAVSLILLGMVNAERASQMNLSQLSCHSRA